MDAIDSKTVSSAKRWWMYAAVALGYALAYTAIRPLSVTYWPFSAGLRVAFLMLTPRRYWPALVVGEVVPLVYFNAQCLDSYGLPWVVVASIPPIVFGMPVMIWFRNRAGLFPTPGMVNLARLLVCMLALSVIWASVKYVTLSTVQLPSGPYDVPSGVMMGYLISNYSVLLLMVPWIILIRMRGLKHLWPLFPLRTQINVLLMRDVGFAVLILTALIGWHHVATDLDTQAITLMSLFMPSVWLTLKHGWRASIVGGTLSLACICALLTWGTEPFNLRAQAMMAMAVTSLYFVGARISEQGREYGRARQHEHDHQDVARHALVLSEEHRQRAAQALQSMAHVVQSDYADMQTLVPHEERHEFLQRAKQLWQCLIHLAESLHPHAWREGGLGLALQETLGKALREAQLGYQCDPIGRELRFLSPALQAAVYRATCDAVVALASSPACIGVHLTVRSGRYQGRRGVMLRMESQEDAMNVARTLLQAPLRDRMAALLGASFRSIEQARQLVRVFDGQLHVRELLGGKRIAMLLWDQAPNATVPPESMRFWVEGDAGKGSY